jgi:mannose-6-phosphate isomerase
MIIRLEPIALSKVWGGQNLSKVYQLPQSNIGEIWGISAHKSFSNKIISGPFVGMTFIELYLKHRDYFGNYSKDEFPLLFKIIDALGDLSVQVHPSDTYALKNEHSYGKDECWYILEAENNTRIQIGHKATHKKVMQQAIVNNHLENILVYHQISKGDYYYIPSGKVHAICKHTTLLEVSQSSDITYRLYDYNRLDKGVLRELHIEKSLDVITFPDTINQRSHNDKYFSFEVMEVENQINIAHIYGDYIYVIEGHGYLNDESVHIGDFVVITSNFEYNVMGKMKLAVVRISNNVV